MLRAGIWHLKHFLPTGATYVLQCTNLDMHYIVFNIACRRLQAPDHLQKFQAGGKLDTFDIEELVAEGSKGCAPLSPSLMHFTCRCGLAQPGPPGQEEGWNAAFAWQLLSC